MNVSPPHSVASSTTTRRSSGTRPAASSQPRRRRPAQPSGLPSAQACTTRRPSSRSATLKPCVSQSVSAASTIPPGRTMRAASRSAATGSSRYSSTCTRHAASCEPDASGSASASASTSSQPRPRASTASSIARAESTAVTCAPRACRAAANAPGPQPMSATRQPDCGPSRSIWSSRTAETSGAAYARATRSATRAEFQLIEARSRSPRACGPRGSAATRAAGPREHRRRRPAGAGSHAPTRGRPGGVCRVG